MKLKALIVDGHNFLFRGYHGVPPEAKRPDGTPINAIYGFFSLLRNTLKDINPNYLIITFDSETSIDHKKEARPEYKSNRPLEHNSVYCQLPLIKRCLDLMGICWIEDKDFEADDLIGTYAEILKKHNIKSYIASSDFDFMQLISDHTSVVRGRHGNIDIFDASRVFDNFGILPDQYLDYLAMVGDSSDNIKGIKGIGKNRASNLLKRYESIKNIYCSFDSLPETLKRLLSGNEKLLSEQREFLKIKKNLKINNKFNIEKFSFSSSQVPDKMGKFLDEHWKNIIR